MGFNVRSIACKCSIGVKCVRTDVEQTILAIHVALALFEDLPFTYLLLSAVTHLCLLSLLPAFPAIYLTEPRFILSGVLSIFNHCVWFYHFTSVYYPFPQILAFFSLCVWLCPFLFFISLSANEYTLPSSVITSTGDSDVPSAKKRSSWFLSLFATLRRQQEEIMPGMFGVSSNTKLT